MASSTTDASALALEQTYGRFPEDRIRRLGLTEAQITALRESWADQPLSWRYQQGLAIAASPDDWVAAELADWPPPVAVPQTAYVGPMPPDTPQHDWLWWSTVTESFNRWDAVAGDWIPESSSAAGAFVPLSVLGLAGGVATLDANGKLLSAQIPSLAIGQVFVVSSQAQMLGLTTAHVGDVAKRTDTSPASSFILADPDPTILANWVPISDSSGAVSTVNGQVGDVTLGPVDVGTDAAGTPRPPTPHKASHGQGGSDPLTPADIGAAADSAAMHKAGTETVSGDKDFTGALTHNGTGVVITTDGRLGDARTPVDASVTNPKLPALGPTSPQASKIAITTSGLVIVQSSHTDVQSALADLDARAAASPRFRGTWAPGTAYTVNDLTVSPSGSMWIALSTHTSGGAFPGGAGGLWRLAGAGALADLLDAAIANPANGDVPIWNSTSGRWQNGPMITPNGEIALAVNETAGAGAPQSTNGSGGQGTTQTIPNLSVTVLQGQSRPVYLTAVIAMTRDDALTSSATCTILVYETTGGAAIAAAGQSAIGWSATFPMPTPPVVAFTLTRALCQITPAMTVGIDRSWGVGYYVGSAAPGGVKAHATLAAPVSGVHSGAVLLAERK